MDSTTALDIVNLALGLINEPQISNIDPDQLTGTERTTAQKVVPFYDPARKQLLSLARWAFAKEQKKLEVAWLANGGTENNGGEVELYHVAHGLATGASVVVRNTQFYDGKWIITRVDADNIVLDNSVYRGAGTLGEFAKAPPFGYQYMMALPSDCIRVHSVDGMAANAAARFWKTIAGMLHYNLDTAHIVYCKDVETVTEFTPYFKSALTKMVAANAAMALLNNSALRTQYLREIDLIDIPEARLQNEIDKDEQPYETNHAYGQPFRNYNSVADDVVLDAAGGSY